MKNSLLKSNFGVAGIAFFLAIPLYFAVLGPRLWPLAFVSYFGYSLFYFIQIEQPKLPGLVRIFIFTFCFWFFKRIFEFESVFVTAIRYYDDPFKGIFFVTSLFFILALAAGFFGSVSYVIVTLTKNSFFQVAILIILMLLLFWLNDIYLPLSPEVALFSSQSLLQTLHFTGALFFKIFFVSTCVVAAWAYVSYREKFWLVLLGPLLVIATTTSLGAIKKENFIASEEIHIVLLQTYQSSLRPEEKLSTLQILDRIRLHPFPKYNSGPVLFVWPESAFESVKEAEQAVGQLKKDLPFSQVHVMGLSERTDQGIKNSMLIFDSAGQLKGRYDKNILFPIGELEISLPFWPENWVKPNVKVLKSNQIDVFLLPDFPIVMPLICYESVFQKQYRDMLLRSNQRYPRIFINISRDSFYEGTSLPGLHSLYSHYLASANQTAMIRVSTTGHSEIIDQFGKTIVQSHKNQFEIVTGKLILYQEK
jgi:apolipoprotein N-acyltransferase